MIRVEEWILAMELNLEQSREQAGVQPGDQQGGERSGKLFRPIRQAGKIAGDSH